MEKKKETFQQDRVPMLNSKSVSDTVIAEGQSQRLKSLFHVKEISLKQY